MPILDSRGNPITSFKKGPSPTLGEKFAPRWAGDFEREFFTFPGGGTVMFDLSKLTLADFRTMRDHYQVNATLAVLTFMVHQMDWKIECDNSKIAKAVTENMREIWTQLVRGLSQAFWAGYSPNVLQWENDMSNNSIQLTKVKDLIPEQCCVNWKQVEGYAPTGMLKPKINVYDGIKVWGQSWPVPVDNTLWYPLMMENGDYYGRKLLRPVFTSWYFSILVHLFSNRYFERFGEPVPVGRAPYDEEITVSSTTGAPVKVNGAQLMVQTLQNLRNRSVVVLPNEKSTVGNETDYDYSIEYLESQMRGADFERYLMRLDEEISLGLFTPLLILRTADVGSYNLGSTHWNMYLNMLNAIVGDIKLYVDQFVLSRMVDYNFGLKAPRAKIIFRKMGDDKYDLVTALLQSMIGKGTAKPDLEQLGDIAGLTFVEVKQLTTPDGGDPNAETKPGKTADPQKTKSGGSGKTDTSTSSTTKKSAKNSLAVIRDMSSRVGSQANRFIRQEPGGGSFDASLGYRRQLADALRLDVGEDSADIADRIVSMGQGWLSDLPTDYVKQQGASGISTLVESTLSGWLEELINV